MFISIAQVIIIIKDFTTIMKTLKIPLKLSKIIMKSVPQQAPSLEILPFLPNLVSVLQR